MPVVCVDALLVGEIGSERRIGLIRRADGEGREGWAMIGGRVRRFESLREAVLRHVDETLDGDFQVGAFDIESPGMVVQYFPNGSPGQFVDRAKHAVSSSYIVPVSGELAGSGARPRSEALGFKWFRLDERPESGDYVHGHGTVVERLIGVEDPGPPERHAATPPLT